MKLCSFSASYSCVTDATMQDQICEIHWCFAKLCSPADHWRNALIHFSMKRIIFIDNTYWGLIGSCAASRQAIRYWFNDWKITFAKYIGVLQMFGCMPKTHWSICLASRLYECLARSISKKKTVEMQHLHHKRLELLHVAMQIQFKNAPSFGGYFNKLHTARVCCYGMESAIKRLCRKCVLIAR